MPTDDPRSSASTSGPAEPADGQPSSGVARDGTGDGTGDGAHRREFLRGLAGVGVGLAAGGLAAGCGATASAPRSRGQSVMGFHAPPIDEVKLAVVGVGGRGTSLLNGFLKVEGVRVVAVCDIREEATTRAQGMCTGAGREEPVAYTDGDYDYRRLCAESDADLVVIATPWRWHVPMAVSAMRNGKHTVTEVPAATTLEGCWELVQTAEETQRHCMMLENVCYGSSELMVLNMVRQGLFGELLHGEAAYIHDLRGILFSEVGEGLWRTQHSVDRDGNLYPTHGLGPVAQSMGINRGDRFNTLVSMSTKSAGMPLDAERRFDAGHAWNNVEYRCGDMNTSLVRTARGRTIMIQHDTTSPRPYDRINLIQGTKGTFRGFPDRIYVEGRSPGHGFEDLAPYREFTHPLWEKVGEIAKQVGGHGGMDYVMSWRLIDCLRRGLPLDMDVYDAASWSAVSELSERSVAQGSAPQEFPDFTRGQWKTTPPLGIVS